MSSRRRNGLLASAAAIALVAFILSTRGPGKPTPTPSGSFSFAVLGDSPYYVWEELQYRLVLQALDAHDLSFVIHVGDIFWRPCSDRHYRKFHDLFNGLRHPVIYTPGDNEWVDCWEPGSGAYAPLERLESIRRIFFSDPTRSLGGAPIPLESQAGREPFPEFVEHARWVHDGVVFATVNIVGSWNAREPFEARTEADDDAVVRRTEAATAWLRDTFAEARARDAAAVVLAYHADANLEKSLTDRHRLTFEPFVTALEEEVDRFAGPVLIAHGDYHEFKADHPLSNRTTGEPMRNLTRLEVPGSPDVGWVRVVFTPGAEPPFRFEPNVIPGWKFW